MAERNLLISVVKHEENRFWGKLENILGTSWDTDMLLDEGNHGPPPPLGDRVSTPLIPMVAGEAFSAFLTGLRARNKKNTIEVGNLDLESAKDFFRGL